MKYVVIPGVLFIAVVLQVTLLTGVAIGGMGVNLFLCVTIMLLLMTGETGVVVGSAILIGIVYDLCYAQYVGPASAAIVLTALVAYVVDHHINSEHLVPMLAITAGGTLVYNFILWVIYRFLDSPYTLLYVLTLQPVYILYNVATVAGLYFVVLFWRRRQV